MMRFRESLLFRGKWRDAERDLFIVGELAALGAAISEIYNCFQLITVDETKIMQIKEYLTTELNNLGGIWDSSGCVFTPVNPNIK